MSNKVDLNCDLGESFGRYQLGMDAQAMPLISSANVACGFHAADPVVMLQTVGLIEAAGIGIGAHPSFPDLQGFGRRNMSLSFEEAKATVLYQLGALDGFCRAKGIKMQHVKPHGALYNMAAKDYELSRAICEAIQEFDPSLIVMGLSGSETIRAAKDLGLKAAQEVFADRSYEPDGSLVARSKAGAFIHDEEEAVARVVRMVSERKVKAVNGEDIAIQADSICVHGDGEKALVFIEKIREGLQGAGIKISPLAEIIG
ncbi:MAG: LamB/YcsF family protein [Turicibacter sp.]|nr:LamB/YcsF family protein [Turicibacter sp.]